MKLCGFEVGQDQPIFLIAGTCVIESRQMAMDTAGTLKEITSALGIPFIYKSSFDKANRSSGTSFRGPGMEKGLEILADVKRDRRAGADRRPHRGRDDPEVRASSTCCRPRPSCAARPISSTPAPVRACR
jgi:hypothetical protein